ncbi:EF-hand domain-containing protein [Pinirhizobacter soli]|uniref:EF-hand domain-containing protein n=1 Tax=Pinirhizobacter soli TaxID=2786953 RepID=UPI00202A3C4F|nr:EF-hand domain-containing protein [Pinirhizobacter soli]
MQLRHVLAAGAIATLLAGPAFALQEARGAPSAASDSSTAPSFDELDKDHKGSISRGDIPKDVESLKQLRAHFGEADQDHNGRLSPAEYNTYVGASKVPGADQHR